MVEFLKGGHQKGSPSQRKASPRLGGGKRCHRSERVEARRIVAFTQRTYELDHCLPDLHSAQEILAQGGEYKEMTTALAVDEYFDKRTKRIATEIAALTA